ncbi:uncharacterized protein LOC112349522 [Selaginella moellendorffii]|uniref:uncharacterized protein LOC112349522 n=1 Tax=Selaginella moellendorffii TaxID=88036 RepID=UPI000D1C5753|nr:uncharacterized protein LOC112349522 [Selaginella moellendorffii]|eukprot:XP_024539900.1 uncharacterized protein LOC112349522 [Selaginella moellendorffii]
MRKSVELDDSSLVEIFSKVGDARQIAQFSLVCKRWRELRWAVTRLHFDFTARDKTALRKKEDAITSVLQRTKKIAPGCLKELKVSLSCLNPSEATGHWLLWPDSLTVLDLEVWGCLELGPAVWSLFSCFRKLESFRMAGDFYSSKSLFDQSPFSSLRSCQFCRSASVSPQILEALLAACPTLEYLSVTGFVDTSNDLTLKSASLESFQFSGDFEGDEVGARTRKYRIGLDAPKLGVLKVGGLADGMSVGISHPESLRELELSCYGSCVVDSKQFYNLKRLKIAGNWEHASVFHVLNLTPMITELSFENTETTNGIAIPIGEILSPLVSLESIHFDGFSLKWFQGDVDHFKFETLTVHVWVNGLEQAPDLDVLGDLLRVHQIRMLVVHYIHEDMINPVSRSMNKRYVSWRLLFDLMLSFPSRISLKKE